MKKLLLITTAALVGLVSQATAALTVMNTGPSDLATELRALTVTDWAGAVATGKLNTSAGLFIKNNLIDDAGLALTTKDMLLVESIYKKATFLNVYGENSLGDLLINTNLNESKRITTDVDDTLILGFDTDRTNISPGEAAGAVDLSKNDNVWTYVTGDKEATYMLWLLEDYDLKAGRRDDDFNDFIVLGTISAVPEPSTIISLIAVGFLGFVTWRNRRKAKA